MPQRDIAEVVREMGQEWVEIRQVAAVAQGERMGAPCILVLVTGEAETVEKALPRAVDGYPVVVESSGPIRALDDE